jgi:biopolymer transport protein ExbD
MQHAIRFNLTLLLAFGLCGAAWAQAPGKQAEYKRSDMNFYWRSDVLKVDPDAVIITQGNYTQKGDSYFVTIHKKAPQKLYIQVVNDWIEPITPPDMPASLGVAPDAMQIREPQGDVQVAFPSAPATFLPATEGMTVPNGTVVKTGANGTAAVLFGGVDSARLIPNSAAAVQQTVTATSRSTEVDLTAGAVFSKVGQRIGEKEDYQVHTPFGVAAARGTDFVSIAMPTRTDVWIAQGTVELDAPDGKLVGTVKSLGTGSLKIIRYPLMPDMHQAMMASAETMTTAMNFIPMVNLKIKALRDKIAQGVKLTARELDYLGRIKKVPCLIELELVPPPPVEKPVLLPVPAVPATTAAPAPTAPASSAPLEITVLGDGNANFAGATLNFTELKQQLIKILKTNPNQAAVVNATKDVPDRLVNNVTTVIAGSPAKPAAAPAAPSQPVTPPAPPLPPVMELPLNLHLRPDGKIDFQDATLTLDELKPKLEEIAVLTPNQAILIKGRENVSRTQLKKVLAICQEANLAKVTVAKAPQTASVANIESPNAPIETGPHDTIP